MPPGAVETRAEQVPRVRRCRGGGLRGAARSVVLPLSACSLLPVPAPAQEPGGAAAVDAGLLTAVPVERVTLPIEGRAGAIEVVVSLPHDLDPRSSYPALVVLDADPMMGMLRTLEFLWAEDGRTDPVILVGIPFGATAPEIWSHRAYYLLPDSVGTVDYYGTRLPVNDGGGAPALGRFIRDRVLPTVLERYPVDPGRLGLAGFSMGGLFVAWHMVSWPEVFHDYIILAPPLSPPFVGREFQRATARLRGRGFDAPTSLYVSYAEDDLGLVRSGAVPWIEGWRAVEDPRLRFRGEMIPAFRHDAGAVPALMRAWEFLYGR